MTAVRTVGSLLPADILAAALDGSLPGMSPGDYHLAAGETARQAAARSWSYLQGVYRAFRDELARLPQGQRGTQVTREKWLQVLLRELDYGRVPTTPGGHLSIDGEAYPISHLWADVPIHLLGWGTDLDTRSQGVAGAARAPQSMLQEFLNRSDEHLWAVLSNGRRLRLLRDTTAMAGQSYVEFDLEAIFDGEAFSDFALLWLLCHESRLERLPGAPDEDGAPTPGLPGDRWLERWRGHAIATGTRALAQLRGQVTSAIEVLGTGFLQHPGNDALRERLAAGEITPADYQRSLLRTIYRLLFWFVAEDRGLLLDPAAPPDAAGRYDAYFSSARLRRTARRRVGTRHTDRWAAARLVLDGLGAEGGRPELGLPGLGGLFEPTALDVTDTAALPNTALLAAVRLLSTTREKGGQRLRAVDFRNLGAEELGGIYEALLELHPRIDPTERTFALTSAAGNERKKSGSYYTPPDLVALVLDEALDPVLDACRTEADLLAVTVCDPACGSGHFLVAAARRIAVRVAAVRSGETEPTPAMVQAALRDVVGRCIHGVDLNPMAAELAKVSLWLEAVQPGAPLAFLDANIRVGNALIGTTPALLAQGVPDEAFAALTGDDKPTVTALKKRNKAERGQSAQYDLFEQTGIPVGNTALAGQLAAVTAAARVGSLADQHHAATRLAAFEASEVRRRAIAVADAWCAAFTQPKTKHNAAVAVTDKVLRDWASGLAVPEATAALVAGEANRHRFFHWHLEFPQVFRVDGTGAVGAQGWAGGFTVMVGNPPWERVKLQEKEFFDDVPEIASAANAAVRKRLIKALPTSDPALWQRWVEASRGAEATSQFLRTSGRYPLTGAGDVNTYQVFAETFRDLLATAGRGAIISPTGLATDATTAPFFADLVRTETLTTVFDFITNPRIWTDVGNRRFRFAVTAFTGGQPVTRIRMSFLNRHPEEITADRTFTVSPAEMRLVNPNTGTAPVFENRRDAEITLGIYRRHPVLIRDDPAANPWGLSFGTLFHMANDAGLFRTAADLEKLGATFDGWSWVLGEQRWLPLYEAKMLGHFDHRLATYAGRAPTSQDTEIPRITDSEHDNPDVEPLARYWVAEPDAHTALGHRWQQSWFFGWRDITRNINWRTMVPSVLPHTAVGNKFPLAFPSDPSLVPLLQTAWSSLAFDYVARQKLSGTGMTYFILKQIACPAPAAFDAVPGWLDTPLRDWILPRVLELTYTSHRIAGYARDLGDDGPPFRWDPDRRFAIRAELDAAMLHLYGLDRDEAEHVLDSFPVVRKYEEAPVEKGGYGEFRTKRMVLAAYDAMAEAARAGRVYSTDIDPTPGHGARHG